MFRGDIETAGLTSTSCICNGLQLELEYKSEKLKVFLDCDIDKGTLFHTSSYNAAIRKIFDFKNYKFNFHIFIQKNIKNNKNYQKRGGHKKNSIN